MGRQATRRYGRRVDSKKSPRDKWITVYGRKPVLEALHDPKLSVAKVVLADNATGGSMQEILRAAEKYVADGLLEREAFDAGRAVLTLRGRLLADAVVRDLVD